MYFRDPKKEHPIEGTTVLARLDYGIDPATWHYDELMYYKKHFITQDGSICETVVGWIPLSELSSIETK